VGAALHISRMSFMLHSLACQVGAERDTSDGA
jgi:hypothetical protein